MAGANFSMNLKGLQDLVAGAASRLSESREIMEAVGETLVSAAKERFEEGQGPDGKAWKKSARAEAEGGQTLVKDGHLKSSVSYEASPTAVAVGTSNDVYGGIHQFGGTIKPKSAKAPAFKVGGKEVFARKVTIPARPFIGISEEDLAEARETVARFIREGLGG